MENVNPIDANIKNGILYALDIKRSNNITNGIQKTRLIDAQERLYQYMLQQDTANQDIWTATYMAYKALQHIYDTAPITTFDPIDGNKIKPEKRNIDNFNNVTRVLLAPNKYVKNTKMGKYEMNDINILKNIYPELHADILMNLAGTLHDKKLSYEKRTKIKSDLGLSIDRARRYQQAYVRLPANEPTTKGRSIGESHIKRMIRSEQTEIQKLTGGKS